MTANVLAQLRAAGDVPVATSVDSATDRALMSVNGVTGAVSAATFREYINADGSLITVFETRADLVTFMTGKASDAYGDGAVFMVGPTSWRWLAGNTSIPTLPNMVPNRPGGLPFASQFHFMVDENDSTGEAAAEAWAAANNAMVRVEYSSNAEDVGAYWTGDPRGMGLNRSQNDGALAMARVITDSKKKLDGYTAGDERTSVMSLLQVNNDPEAGGDSAPLMVSNVDFYGAPLGERRSMISALLSNVARDGAADGVNPSTGTTGGQFFTLYSIASFPQTNNYRDSTALTRRDAGGQAFGTGFKNFGGVEQHDYTSADGNDKYAIKIEAGGDAPGEETYSHIARSTAIMVNGPARDTATGRSGYFFGDVLSGIWTSGHVFRAPPEKARGVRMIEIVNNFSTLRTLKIHRLDDGGNNRASILDTLTKGDMILARVNATTFLDEDEVWIVHDMTTDGTTYDVRVTGAGRLDLGGTYEFRFYQDTGGTGVLHGTHSQILAATWTYSLSSGTPTSGQILHPAATEADLNNAPYDESMIVFPHNKGFGVFPQSTNDYQNRDVGRPLPALNYLRLDTNVADDAPIGRFMGRVVIEVDGNDALTLKRNDVDWDLAPDPDGSTFRVLKDNDAAASFTEPGEAAPLAVTVMTREKGDARYNFFVTPKQFGALADGSDQGTELQAWIDYLVANPGRIGYIDDRYSTASDLVADGPVKIVSGVSGANGSGSSEPSSEPCALVALSGCVDLLTIAPDVSGERVWGSNVQLYIDCNNQAERGLVIDRAVDMDIDLRVVRPTVCGLDFIDSTGLSGSYSNAFVRVHRYKFLSGSNAACRKAIGLRIDGTSTSGGTQFTLNDVNCANHYEDIATIEDNGSGVALITCDSAHQFQVGDPVIVYNTLYHDSTHATAWATVASVPSATQVTVTGLNFVASDTGGFISASVGMWFGDTDSSVINRYQGHSAYFAGDRLDETPPRRAARKVLVDFIASNIILDDGALIKFGLVNSEDSTLTKFGSATAAGDLVDRNDGRFWTIRTHKLTDQKTLHPGNGPVLDVATISATAAFAAPAISHGDTGTTSKATWTVPIENDWDEGDIVRGRLVYSSNLTTGNFRIQVTIAARSIGQGVNGGNSVAFTIPAPGTGNDLTEYVFDLGTSFSKGEYVFVRVERLSGDALDTSTGNFLFYGLTLDYEADGPIEASKRFQKPDMVLT